MKKTLAIVVALVCVLSAALGGVAYAITGHQPVAGSKLIGYGPIGRAVAPIDQYDSRFDTWFTITNPDCSGSVAIGQLSIVEQDGTVIYEGPFLKNGPGGGTVTTLEPHQVEMVRLSAWISAELPSRFYTVEIGWSAKGKVLPLIGHAVVFQRDYLEDGSYTLAKTRVPMEKMKQQVWKLNPFRG